MSGSKSFSPFSSNPSSQASYSYRFPVTGAHGVEQNCQNGDIVPCSGFPSRLLCDSLSRRLHRALSLEFAFQDSLLTSSWHQNISEQMCCLPSKGSLAFQSPNISPACSKRRLCIYHDWELSAVVMLD